MDIKYIKIKLRSVRYELQEFLLSELLAEAAEEIEMPEDIDVAAESENIEISTDGKLCETEDRVEISYDETELTGMEGSKTSISYDKKDTGIITMVREGTVSTALVFEQGKRHHCVYKTPYMPFQICVHTLCIENKLNEEGRIYIDYIIEIRGAKAERTKLELKII